MQAINALLAAIVIRSLSANTQTNPETILSVYKVMGQLSKPETEKETPMRLLPPDRVSPRQCDTVVQTKSKPLARLVSLDMLRKEILDPNGRNPIVAAVLCKFAVKSDKG